MVRAERGIIIRGHCGVSKEVGVDIWTIVVMVAVLGTFGILWYLSHIFDRQSKKWRTIRKSDGYTDEQRRKARLGAIIPSESVRPEGLFDRKMRGKRYPGGSSTGP